MSKLVDMTAQKFNRWLVLARVQNSSAGQTRWLCRCECGTEAVVQAAALKAGHSKSCGCLKVETTVARSTKHGHATRGISPTYHSWVGMIARCENSQHRSFQRYGARGITVCERWHSFDNFLADMGEKPLGRRSIDRLDNNRGYEPENCVWASDKTQARNKCNNRLVTANGATHCIAEWAELTGIHAQTIIDRLNAGDDPEQALEFCS